MNALTASYDEVDNRVALIVTSDPNIASVSVLRTMAGSAFPIPSLTYMSVHPSGNTLLYDYAAPLNQETTYQCVFYRGCQRFVDSTAEASVTPTPTLFWMKKPPGAVA